MNKTIGITLGIVLTLFSNANGEDLLFPSSEAEIASALSFREATILHEGQKYMSTEEGEIFMVVEGKRYRMKGIGGLVHTSLVPKAGALVTFDYNSSLIKSASHDLLGQYGKVLKKDLSQAKLIIEGHTDNFGEEGYNYQLSEERAKAVKKYLVNNYDISPDRLLIRGAGERRPIASNESDDGRALNRRVEFIRIVAK